MTSAADTSFMFFDSANFNADLSGWDVSNVVNMGSMFNGATSFNADLSMWNVSIVTATNFMFSVGLQTSLQISLTGMFRTLLTWEV